MRVYLRLGKVHETAVRVFGVVRQRYGDIGLPGAGGVLLPEIDVPLTALEVVECGHAEIHQHRVALYYGCQERLATCPHQRTQVDQPLTDVARDGGTDDGVSQLLLRLEEVGLTHCHRRHGTLIGSHGIVQVQLAGGVLCIQRTDTLQVPLCLPFLRLVFLKLRTCLVRLGTVLLLVDDKQDLILCYIGSFLKEHLFQKAFHTGTYLHELLRPDAPHVFPVDVHILLRYRYGCHHRHVRLGSRTMSQYPDGYSQHYQCYKSVGNFPPRDV